MARALIGSGLPDADGFLTVLDGLKTATVTLVNSKTATFTVGSVLYTITGTGLTVANGKLTGGNVTEVLVSEGTKGIYWVTDISITVAEINTAVAQEVAGTTDALDKLIGGDDDDWAIDCGDGNDVVTAPANGVDYFKGGPKYYFDGGNDTANGGTGDDNFYGGTGNDSLAGNNGNDRAVGDSGNDLVYGGAGNDLVYGGDGTDLVYGGSGNDKVYGAQNDGVADKLYGEDGNDKIVDGNGSSSLYGGTGVDKLYGGIGDDSLYGGDGNDTLDGADGTDLLWGDVGKDSITAGAGNDTLYGGADGDTLSGGLGADVLSGGGGADTFKFAVADLGLNTTKDTILDFTSGSDKVYLKGMGLSFITGSFTSSDLDPEIRWNASQGRLELDLNGDNTVDAHIGLQAGANVTANDLIL